MDGQSIYVENDPELAKVNRFRREMLCDIMYRLIKLLVFSIIVMIDRSYTGRNIGHNLDVWVDMNLGLFAIEICFRNWLRQSVNILNYNSL